MEQNINMQQHGWAAAIAAVGLGLLWSLVVPSVTMAQMPGAVCVLQVIAEGEVFSILVDAPQSFNIAVPIPPDQNVNVPVPCDRVGSMALAVSNQKNRNVNIVAQVYTTEGGLLCSKGPFLVPVNGATGLTFADCLP